MNFSDYENNTIELSKESWEHVQEFHPEITLDEIGGALREPDEVRKSRYKDNVHLYYGKKLNSSSKKRLIQVVVKFCDDGNFVSTAMTTNKPKKGEIVFENPKNEKGKEKES